MCKTLQSISLCELNHINDALLYLSIFYTFYRSYEDNAKYVSDYSYFQWDEYEATKLYLEQLDLIIQVSAVALKTIIHNIQNYDTDIDANITLIIQVWLNLKR